MSGFIATISVESPEGWSSKGHIKAQGCSCRGNNHRVTNVDDPRLNFLLRKNTDEVRQWFKSHNDRIDRQDPGARKWRWSVVHF